MDFMCHCLERSVGIFHFWESLILLLNLSDSLRKFLNSLTDAEELDKNEHVNLLIQMYVNLHLADHVRSLISFSLHQIANF